MYDLVKNESEERNERERVKSILQSNSPPGDRRISFFPGDVTVSGTVNLLRLNIMMNLTNLFD